MPRKQRQSHINVKDAPPPPSFDAQVWLGCILHTGEYGTHKGTPTHVLCVAGLSALSRMQQCLLRAFSSLATFRKSGMFSTWESLQRRTGPYGIGRFSYLQALVTEYQEPTTSAAAKLEVSTWSGNRTATYSTTQHPDPARRAQSVTQVAQQEKKIKCVCVRVCVCVFVKPNGCFVRGYLCLHYKSYLRVQGQGASSLNQNLLVAPA